MESDTDTFGFNAEPDGDNLYKWKIELFGFEEGSLLKRDLDAYAARTGEKPAIQMEMKFPSDYPMAPPFVRVVKPRFAFLTGHVTIGGSVCMQVLTNSGWTPTNSVEGVIVQVRAEIASDPKAQLDATRADTPYVRYPHALPHAAKLRTQNERNVSCRKSGNLHPTHDARWCKALHFGVRVPLLFPLSFFFSPRLV